MKFEQYLNEMASTKDIGAEIEDMDINVETMDRQEFNKILNKALKKVDKNNKLSIIDAVQKMKNRDAQKLLNDLLDLNYNK